MLIPSQTAMGRIAIFMAILFMLQFPAFHIDRQINNNVAAKAADDMEPHALRAERLRKESKARAVSRLGYETVGDPNEAGTHPPDYHALGLLISRLGKIMQEYETERTRPIDKLEIAPGLPAMGGGNDEISRTYGPEGPTVQSVRALLSYRLVTLGNRNLKVGSVKDARNHVLATVVTRDNSLVASYRIEKRNGRWHQIDSGG
jgi:hypothetical protein